MLAEEPRTIVLYESRHRLIKTLNDLLEILGNRIVSVSRELTKLHEETTTAPLKEVIDHFEKGQLKGEFVIVVSSGEKT